MVGVCWELYHLSMEKYLNIMNDREGQLDSIEKVYEEKE